MFTEFNNIKKSPLILDFTSKLKISDSDIKKFFNILLYIMLLNYRDNKETYLPGIGSIKFIYKKDKKIKDEGKIKKQAEIETKFIPDNRLLKEIGQIQDGEETETEKYFLNYIKQRFNDYLK